jgi:two-component system NtrC family response regulator
MKILIADDDRTVCQSLRLLFLSQGHDAQYIINPLNILEFIESYAPDVLLLDLNFSVDTSGEQGLQILKDVHAAYERLPVILITAWGTLDLAVQGMKAGASDFVTKPWENEVLMQKVQTQWSLRQTAVSTKANLLDELVGSSEAMKLARELLSKAASSEATLWISGSRGTGKDLLVSIYHRMGNRSGLPLLKLEDSEEVEAELWGYRKGVFPGSTKDHRGLLSKIGEGNLQISAWESLSSGLQSKLLKVIEERKFTVIGSDLEMDVRCGWLATSHFHPDDSLETGALREDLYYRLAQVHIHLPDLDERREDMPELIRHFSAQLNAGERKRKLEESAIEWLSTCSFPGNVRQLKAYLERVWLLSEQYTLNIKELKKYFAAEDKPADLTLEGMEKEMIKKAIAQKKGNMSEVAKTLGITRSALYRRMSKFGIQHED